MENRGIPVRKGVLLRGVWMSGAAARTGDFNKKWKKINN